MWGGVLGDVLVEYCSDLLNVIVEGMLWFLINIIVEMVGLAVM